MKSLLIYDSYFGNTEEIAKTIAKQLNTQAINVKEFNTEMLDNIDLLVVGSPTRAFSPSPNINNFISKLPKLENIKVVSFDTRMDVNKNTPGILKFLAKIFGYAAEPILKKLKRKGAISTIESKGFYVKDMEGPLEEGENQKAIEWIKTLS